MPIPAAIGIGLKAAPYVLGALRLGRGRPKIDWEELSRYSSSLRPSGHLSAEDLQAGEGVRRRLSGAVAESGANLRLEALRRLRQRNVDVSGSSEATLGRIGETVAAGHERAAEGAEEYLGNVRLGNQRFEQQKALGLLGARLGDAVGERSRQDLRNTTFFNSLLDITPDIIGGIDKLSTTRALGVSGGGGSNVSSRPSDEDLGIY